MRPWVGAVLAGMCVVGAVGCQGHSRNTARRKSAPNLAEVEWSVPPLDPGVMRVGAAVELPERIDGPAEAVPAPAEPGGLRLFLDRCKLRAPGEREVNGRVELPKDAHDVNATLALGLVHGDVVLISWTHRVTFSRSGTFAVVLPTRESLATSEATGLLEPRTPIDDSASGCRATLMSASVPIETQVVSVTSTISHEPFVYSAPRDSIQSLGIGAPLRDKHDARTISLYTVWADRRSAITKVWVPVVAGQRPALLSVAPSHPWCTQIRVGIGDLGNEAQSITVVTRLNCGAPGDGHALDETHRPVPGASGFTWARPVVSAQPDIARRSIGQYEVWVEGGSAVTLDRVARVAAALTTRRNLATTGRPVPARPATLDAALASFVANEQGMSGMHERARFPYRGNSMIFLETAQPAAWDTAVVEVGHIAGGWWVERVSSSGSPPTRCFTTENLVYDVVANRFAYAFTTDRRWTMQEMVDGHWRTIPTTNGVLLETTMPFAAQPRPIDTTGRVPACFLAQNPSG